MKKEYSVAVTLTTDTEEGDVRIREKIAIVLSIAVFVFIFGLLCWPMVCAIRLVGWLFRRSERAIRSQIARCAHWWGSVVFYSACKLLRLDVKIAVEGDRCLIIDRSCVVIANHQSTLDIAVITWLVNRLGLGNSRWVMKRPLRKAPVLGWIAERIGNAFVSRGKNPANVWEIERCAEILREDNASIILFPEGTRFVPARASKKYRHVLPPKKTGFNLFCSALPNAAVVSVTLQWNPPVADGTRGKTMFQAADFYGKSLKLNIRIVAPHEVRSDEEWLERDWEAKDRILSPP
ncbi:MAG: lysophospholipid acyltransferase family protein [Patescibacteria group bacterium]